DVETDLAVLRIEERNLPHLEFGDSYGLKAGQIVLAVGSPLGLQNSITMGIVSATGRQLRPEDRLVYVQTDAATNPGNSGGAGAGLQPGDVVLEMDGKPMENGRQSYVNLYRRPVG